jgi:hypothetical protein
VLPFTGPTSSPGTHPGEGWGVQNQQTRWQTPPARCVSLVSSSIPGSPERGRHQGPCTWLSFVALYRGGLIAEKGDHSMGLPGDTELSLLPSAERLGVGPPSLLSMALPPGIPPNNALYTKDRRPSKLPWQIKLRPYDFLSPTEALLSVTPLGVKSTLPEAGIIPINPGKEKADTEQEPTSICYFCEGQSSPFRASPRGRSRQ